LWLVIAVVIGGCTGQGTSGDDVEVKRGALGNPWIFAHTAALLRDLLRRCGLDVTAVSSDDNVSSNCVAIRPTWS